MDLRTLGYEELLEYTTGLQQDLVKVEKKRGYLERKCQVLEKLTKLQDKYLSCYRLQKNPGLLLDELRKVRMKLLNLEKRPLR